MVRDILRRAPAIGGMTRDLDEFAKHPNGNGQPVDPAAAGEAVRNIDEMVEGLKALHQAAPAKPDLKLEGSVGSNPPGLPALIDGMTAAESLDRQLQLRLGYMASCIVHLTFGEMMAWGAE